MEHLLMQQEQLIIQLHTIEQIRGTNEVVFSYPNDSNTVTFRGSATIGAGLTVTGDINSTSDINLKKDITPVENALDKICKINGVEFEWKKTNKKSIGVIAQEIESILPELVTNMIDNDENDVKTVNYNGLIGVLIEAVKELKMRLMN
jgi:hypothetical protein